LAEDVQEPEAEMDNYNNNKRCGCKTAMVGSAVMVWYQYALLALLVAATSVTGNELSLRAFAHFCSRPGGPWMTLCHPLEDRDFETLLVVEK